MSRGITCDSCKKGAKFKIIKGKDNGIYFCEHCLNDWKKFDDWRGSNINEMFEPYENLKNKKNENR
jgi:hypothetical protein